jgi:ABC-type nitrate/sulfonate/bicarbonate transport system permease component
MVFVAIFMLTLVGGAAYLAVIIAERRVLHYLPSRGWGSEERMANRKAAQ